MPPKAGKAARQQNAANASAKAAGTHEKNESERTLAELESNYNEALVTIQCLESKLADEQSQSANLKIALINEEDKVSQCHKSLTTQ